MKVVCAKFRVEPPAVREWDKVIGDIKQDGGFPKTRRYTSTGPSLALVAASAPGVANIKRKMSTGPRVIIDSDVYVGESSCQDFGDVHGRHPPQPQLQPQGILLGSSRTTPASSSGTTTTGSATSVTVAASTITAAGTDSVTTSPLPHPTGFTWNFFGGVKEKEKMDDKEGDTSRLVGDVVSIADPSDVVTASSSSMTPRPTLNLTPFLPASPEPQHEPQTPYQDNANSDSSSSISMTSPVFAHSTNESDLDDETFLSYGSGGGGGGTGGGKSGVSGTNRPRKGYRYGGYHVQVQMTKVRGADEDERPAGGDCSGVGKAVEIEVEVESKIGNGSQPQQARREEKAREGRNEDEEHERWVALDMVNDNGSFQSFSLFGKSYIHEFLFSFQ